MKKKYMTAGLAVLSAAAMLSMTACAKKQAVQETEAAVEISSEAETTAASETETEADGSIVKLGENTPVEIEGNEFTLKVSDPDPNNADVVRVTAEYGKNTLDLDEWLSVSGIYQIKADSGNYVLVETYTYSDVSDLLLVKLEKDTLTLADTVVGNLDEKPVSVSEGFSIGTRLDVLGTYSGIRKYWLRDDKLETDASMYEIKNPVGDYTITLTTEKEVNCRLDGGNTALKPGTKILPKAYSEDGTFYFELEDGTPGNLIVDLNSDGTYAGTIGGVSESDLFSDLPYAG